MWFQGQDIEDILVKVERLKPHQKHHLGERAALVARLEPRVIQEQREGQNNSL